MPQPFQRQAIKHAQLRARGDGASPVQRSMVRRLWALMGLVAGMLLSSAAFAQAPTLTSAVQAAGPLAGGNVINLFGTGLSSALPSGAVKFGAAYADYQIASDTQLSVWVPAGAAPGPVDVTVTTMQGTSNALVYTYHGLPTVSGVSPTVGATAGGTQVSITGAHLTGATAVTFGSNAAVFEVISDSSVLATSPAGAVGAVAVTVTTPGGSSANSGAATFNYAELPIVAALAPQRGLIAGGASVQLTGGFLSGATAVKFGAVDALSFEIDSATQITAIAPPGVAGIVDVTVTTPEGTSTTSVASQFLYQFKSAIVATPRGDVALLLSGAQCGFKELPTQDAAPDSGVPEGFDFPYGQIAFKADACDAGGSLTVGLTLPDTVAAGAKLYKLVEGEWQPWPASINGSSVAFAVQDDDGSVGATGTGDNDPTAGSIDDPVLLAVPKAVVPAVTPVPVLSPWLLIALSLLLAGLGWRRVRRC